MRTPNRVQQTADYLKPLALALAMGAAASAAFLAESASAQTIITAGSTQNVSDPNTYFGTAGSVTIENDATLRIVPSSQGNYSMSNDLVFAGSGGTINLQFNDNDTTFDFTGSITSTATGAQTLAIRAGVNGNGDREEVTLESGIPDVGDASPLGLQVTFTTQSGSTNYVNLPGVNTFTGPIHLLKGANVNGGYLTIGGIGKSPGGNGYTSTPGSGNLGGGDYSGAIVLDTNTILDYSSSANQTLSGAISGAGSLSKEGTGTLILSNTNTYSGATRVSTGILQPTQNTSLGPDTSVYLSDSGGTLDLAFTGMDSVAELYINGIKQTHGLYDSSKYSKITGSGQLLVGTPLLADFTAAPSTGDAPLDVTFTDTSQSILGTLTTWSWDFGDGTSSTDQNPPVHTYALWGTYTVTLTVTDSTLLQVSTTKTIKVSQALNVVVASEGQYETVVVTVDPANTVTFNTGLADHPDFGGLSGSGTFALANTAAVGVTLEVGGDTMPDTAFSGVMTGSGGLTKVGANMLTLAGENLYAGDTTVSGGTLKLANTAMAAGLDIRAWKNGGNQNDLDGARYSTSSPAPVPNDSSSAGTIDFATESINMNGNDQEHFGTGTHSGVPDSSLLRPTGYQNNYTIEYRGKIRVDGGTYRFATTSDDGSALWIDPSSDNPNYVDAQVQNQGWQGMTTRFSSQMDLAAGYHDVVVRYYEGGGGNGIQVQWDPLGGTSWSAIPGANFSHVPAGGGGGGHAVLPTGTTVWIVTGGILAIDNASNTVARLFLDGIQQVEGTWGSTASTATNQNDTYFSGTGVLVVTANLTAATAIALEAGDNQTGTQGLALANPLVAKVTDVANNPVAGASVTFAVASVPAGATGQVLSILSTPTDGSGLASTALTLGNKVGTYTVTATATGLTGSPVTFTATAVDPFTAWINASYPGLSDKSAAGDPDGDGVSNFNEFAFGLDPSKASSCNPIVQQLNNTTGVFKYTRRATPATTGLSYAVWTSTDLVTWTHDTGASEGSVTSVGGIETVPVTLSGTLPLTGMMFVRVLATSTATVEDPFTAWINAHYPGLSNKTKTGDPDGDGVSNFNEYAFGLDPSKASSCNPIAQQLDKTTGVFKYTRRATPATTGLGYAVWTSTDLVTWTHDTGASEGSITSIGGIETVPVTLSGTLPLSAPTLFVRVVATQAP